MKLSIITVCLNSEKTIEKTIKSIINQDYQDFELIVIDGGSIDGTLKILDQYKKWITYMVSEKDTGIYEAINKGIKVSSGEIISLIHSDDCLYDNQVLSNVVYNFKKNLELDCLIGTTLITKLNTKKIIRKYSARHFKKWMMYFGVSPPHPSSFFKKKIYDNCGLYKVSYKIAGDFEFFLRTIIKNKIVIDTIDKNYVIMQHGGISSRSLQSNLISTKEIFKSFKDNRLYSNFFLISLRFPIKLFQFFFR